MQKLGREINKRFPRIKMVGKEPFKSASSASPLGQSKERLKRQANRDKGQQKEEEKYVILMRFSKFIKLRL